jgi:hypothetical protein
MIIPGEYYGEVVNVVFERGQYLLLVEGRLQPRPPSANTGYQFTGAKMSIVTNMTGTDFNRDRMGPTSPIGVPGGERGLTVDMDGLVAIALI